MRKFTKCTIINKDKEMVKGIRRIAFTGVYRLIMMNRRGWCARFLFKRGEAHRLLNDKISQKPKSNNITLNERRLNAWTGLYNSISLTYNTAQQC